MKVKINIINIRCILMSEAVTVQSLMMMTLTASEESLTRNTDRQTERQTFALSTVSDFENNKNMKINPTNKPPLPTVFNYPM